MGSKQGNPFNSQGAFCKITKEVIERIGYYDVKNMGFRGIGHLDYALRYCREFGKKEFYDIPKGMEYINLIIEDYRHSLPRSKVMEYRQDQGRKIKIAKERENNFIPFDH